MYSFAESITTDKASTAPTRNLNESSMEPPVKALLMYFMKLPAITSAAFAEMPMSGYMVLASSTVHTSLASDLYNTEIRILMHWCCLHPQNRTTASPKGFALYPRIA